MVAFISAHSVLFVGVVVASAVAVADYLVGMYSEGKNILDAVHKRLFPKAKSKSDEKLA